MGYWSNGVLDAGMAEFNMFVLKISRFNNPVVDPMGIGVGSDASIPPPISTAAVQLSTHRANTPIFQCAVTTAMSHEPQTMRSARANGQRGER